MSSTDDYVGVEFRERIYQVPRGCLGGLLSGQGNGQTLKHYEVRTWASEELFEDFINLLACECIPEVTADNVGPLRALASEFGVPDLARECARLFPPEIERDEDRFVPLPVDIAARLVVGARESRALSSEREHLGMVGEEMTEFGPRGKLSVVALEFPKVGREFLNGVIAYLARTHAGNLHAKTVVTIISSSRSEGFAPANILELESPSSFRSEDSPYQWISWTFHIRDIHPVRYTIKSDTLRSWMLEGSPDAWHWFVIDRRREDEHFKEGWATKTFQVKHVVQCRYVRLIQTAQNHQGNTVLSLAAVEFFGFLHEPRYVKSSD
jgi:hypothetical protein